MRDDLCFALVMRMGTGGKSRFPFDYGVCVVEGESARTSFTDLAGLSQVIGDMPCVPSVYGAKPGIVSFEAETEAIDMLTQSAQEFETKYTHGRPEGYEPLRTLIEGGVVATVNQARMGLEIAEWAAAGAGWHSGDRVELTGKPDGCSFALHADRDGHPLVEGEKTEWLSTSRDWPLPPGIDIADGEYLLPFSAGPEGIFMSFPKETRELENAHFPETEMVRPAVSEGLTLSPKLPFDYRWSLVSLAAVYGLLTISLYFI